MSYQNFFNYQFLSKKDNENYFVNETNQKAYDLTVLEDFNQNIFLFGPKKSGKSHLVSIWKDKNNAIIYNKNNFNKIIKNYDYIIDGSDNFKTKFLINDFCIKSKKIFISGAISKFDGHIFAFNFKNKKNPCLRCFFQEDEISDNILNCEFEGVLGTIAGVIGTIQANEVLKQILNIGKHLNGFILILDLLNLNFRKVRLNKRKKCLCK